MIATLLLAQILSSAPAPPAVSRIEGGTRSLSDIAGQLDRDRKAGIKKSVTFSATESTAPRDPGLSSSALLQSSPDYVLGSDGHVTLATEATTGSYVYGPGGTRTYYYYSHAPSHAHASATHAPATHATPKRKHY